MKVLKVRSSIIIFQWIVLGTTGARGDPVLGHVVGAHRDVREPKMHQVMVEQNA